MGSFMKKLGLTLTTFLISFSALAGINHAPPSFPHKEDQVVFVDFKNASYSIVFDYAQKTVIVESTIDFYAPKSGYPIFDLIPEPTELQLNKSPSSAELIQDPDKKTMMRVINQKVEVGYYQLKLKHSLSTNVIFGAEGVAAGFWMSDLTDRKYLEQYLPTNLEFDQYQVSMDVEIINAGELNHTLKTNGKIGKITENHFEVIYPDFYSTSSFYFHLFPNLVAVKNVQFYYQSIDGRLLPVDIYTSYDMDTFVNSTKTILAELEADYGPFPHEQLIIYGNSPSGGMEYAGATSTSLGALGHELFHSYHARALMPANGNAGWMDEAIARWRDNKYPLTAALSFESTQLAGASVWSRMTDRMAYKEGSAFLSWIAYRMNEKGLSFKNFLKDYFDDYKYTTVTTGLFERELSLASGMDLRADFKKYIYGQSVKMNKMNLSLKSFEEDENHPKLDQKQLDKLTWPRKN